MGSHIFFLEFYCSTDEEVCRNIHIKGSHGSLEIARHHLEKIRLGRVRKRGVLIERRAKAVPLIYKGG